MPESLFARLFFEMEPEMTLPTGHSSSATSGTSLARRARLRPLRSHAQVMAEAGASATSHWPTLVESAAIYEGRWPWSRRADGDDEGDLLQACHEAQELECSGWLRRDAARRRRRAARLEAEATAIDGSWSQVRRDAYQSAMARFDGLESRFDSAPNNIQQLALNVLLRLRDLKGVVSRLEATGTPEQRLIAAAVRSRAESLLAQAGAMAGAAAQG